MECCIVDEDRRGSFTIRKNFMTQQASIYSSGYGFTLKIDGNINNFTLEHLLERLEKEIDPDTTSELEYIKSMIRQLF